MTQKGAVLERRIEPDGDEEGVPVDCWNCDGDGGYFAVTDDLGCGDPDDCTCGGCVWTDCDICEGDGRIRSFDR